MNAVKVVILDSLREAIRIVEVDNMVLWQPSTGDCKTPLGTWFSYNTDTCKFSFDDAVDNYTFMTDVDVERDDTMEQWGFDFDSVLSEVIPLVENGFFELP